MQTHTLRVWRAARIAKPPREGDSVRDRVSAWLLWAWVVSMGLAIIVLSFGMIIRDVIVEHEAQQRAEATEKST